MKKQISFLMIFALLFGTLGLNGWGLQTAYGAEKGTAYVRVIDADNEEVLEYEAVSVENGVTTLEELVTSACEANDMAFTMYSYNYPETIGDVELPSGYYWMQMLNDSATVFSGGDYSDITVKDGDRLVIYADSYPSVADYSYFTVTNNGGVSTMEWEGTSYITGTVSLKLSKNVNEVISACENADIVVTDESGNVLSTDNYDYGVTAPAQGVSTTSDTGTISLELYGNCATDDIGSYSKTFIITSEESGIVKPYCKAVMTGTELTLSQPEDESGSEDEESDINHKEDISSDVAAVVSAVSGAGDGLASSYYDNDWALGMAAAGVTPTDSQLNMYLKNVLATVANSGASAAALAKTAVALTALGIDAESVLNTSTGETDSLVARVGAENPDNIGTWGPAWDATYILSMYDLGNYDVPAGSEVTRSVLIEKILNAQAEDGSWDGTSGADATGVILCALAPYYEKTSETNGISAEICAEITTAVDKAVSWLSDNMSEYGGFPGYGGAYNSNTQAMVLAGLHAVGIDTHSGDFCKTASAMDFMLSYKTADNKLGYADNTSANETAMKQGLGALAAYQNLSGSRSSNLYHFSKTVSVYTNWSTDTNILTNIAVSTAPTKTQYDYDESDTAHEVDTEGIVIKAIYNGDMSNAVVLDPSECTFSTIDLSKAGTQTVTVTYEGQTATFTVTVKNADSTVPVEATATVKVKIGSKTIASGTVVIDEGKTTAMDVLKTVLGSSNLDYEIKGNYYVVSINGKGEFDEGQNSGWLYSVNGTTPSTTAASDYDLSDGDEVVWYFTEDYTKDPSSKNWVKEVVEEEDTSQSVIEVEGKVNASGAAEVKLLAKDVAAAVKEAVDSKKTGEECQLVVQVELNKSAKEIQLSVPKAAMKEIADDLDRLAVKTDIADIRFDKDALKTIADKATGSVDIIVKNITTAKQGELTDEQKKLVEDRSIYDFSVMSDNKLISEFGGEVTVYLPYAPASDENSELLVVYHINDGKLEAVRDSVYDSKTKGMKFKTNHFSEFAVGYNPAGFEDISTHWAKDNIMYLAARGIIGGMSENTFAPSQNITRAQFVQILANMSGADLSIYSSSPFNDVTEKSWFAGSAAWAYEQGIVTGAEAASGELKYNPNANITRQDMAVILTRYMALVENKELEAVSDKAVFADESSVASYAKEAVSKMQQAGIINGKTASTFAPKDNATRAEASKMIAVLLKNNM